MLLLLPLYCGLSAAGGAMTISDWIRLAIAFAAVLVVAFSTAVLVGFSASSRTRLSELATRDGAHVRNVDNLLTRSHLLQSAMITLDTAAAAVAVVMVTVEWFGRVSARTEAAIIVACVMVILIFGRAVPRAIAHRLPEQIALALARFARVVVLVLTPVTALLDLIARVVIRLLRIPSATATTTFATEEELIQLVREEAGDNRIEEEEVDLVNSIFRFTDTVVREIMVPRVDMVGVPRDATVAQAVAAAREGGHSRLPVYEESLDRIVGVVYAKDLLQFVGRANTNAPIFALMRQPLYVPETKGVPELLRELQSRRIHLAIAVDEYGGTAGLVTIEDILEEIVGEIQDEYDSEPPLAQALPDGAYSVSARLTASDVVRLMGTEWPNQDEEREPVAGIMYDRLGHIPVVGEDVRVAGLRFIVTEMDNQRIEKVRVEHVPEEPGELAAPVEVQMPVELSPDDAAVDTDAFVLVTGEDDVAHEPLNHPLPLLPPPPNG